MSTQALHAAALAAVMLTILTAAAASAQDAAAPVTAPAAAPVTTPAQAPAALTAPVVTDYGALDLELTTVTDFNQLDLEAMLNATVESASKKSESIARAPAIIEVLTRRQLLDLGARDLYTALTFLPGIEVLETFGGIPTLVFRGALQEQYNVKVLLLINGHPSYEPVTSGYFLDMIPLESIDRIEVIRGPGSVLYGNNAFAGVINVITVAPAEGEILARARGEAGQFTTAGGGAGAAGRRGDFAWSLFAAGQSQRGWPYRVTPQQNEDCMLNSDFGKNGPPRPADCRHTTTLPYFNDYASGLASLQYKGLTLQAGGITRDKQKYSFLPTLRFHDFDSTEHAYGDLSYRHEFKRLTLTARGGYDRNQQYWRIGRFPDPKATASDTKADVLSYIYRASVEAGWSVTATLRLDQGVSWEHNVLDHIDFLLADGSINKFSPQFAAGMPAQSTSSYYAQGTWQAAESLSLLAGYRLSRFETLGVRVSVDDNKVATNNLVDEEPLNLQSPRGGVVFAPRDDLSFKLLYGEAFRLTNISDTATVIPLLIGVASPVLPETIRTVEFGVDSRPLDRLSVRANVYESWLANLVGHRLPNDTHEVDTFGATTIITANVWRQRIYGVEAEATLIVSEKLSVFANASARHAQVDPMHAADVEVAGPHRRYFTAPFTANGGASWRPVAWFAFHPNAQYVGPRGYAEPYTLVGAVAEFPVTGWLTLSALGNNLLDAAVENPEYVRRYIKVLPGAPGRALYGRAAVEF